MSDVFERPNKDSKKLIVTLSIEDQDLKKQVTAQELYDIVVDSLEKEDLILERVEVDYI